MSARIRINMDEIIEFCRKWHVIELALFGSVLREDFGPESDVDVLVSFAPDAHVSLFELVDVEDELAAMLGRKVDLVCREGIEQSPNPLRKRAILDSAEVLYAA